MGDAPARTELKVTTGPIRGSRKICFEGRVGVRVAMRAVDLEPTSGEPPVTLYDTVRPLHATRSSASTSWPACPSFERQWIRGRGDVEEVAQREVKPEDNGQLGPDRSGGVAPFPNVRKRVLRARPGHNVTQMHYARRGIVTPEMEYVAIRENLGRTAAAEAAARDGQDLRRRNPRPRHPRVRPRRGRARPRHHPQQHQPPGIGADGDRPQFPGQDQRQHRQQRRRLRRRVRSRQDGVGDPLGRRHGHGPSAPAATSTTPANGSSATRPSRSAPSPSTRRWRRSAESPKTSPGKSSPTRSSSRPSRASTISPSTPASASPTCR